MSSDTSDQHEYSSLVNEKDEEGQLDWQNRRPSSHRSWRSAIWSAIPWFLTACCMSLITVWSFSKPTELECTKLLNPYSPLIEQDIISYHSADFANSFAHETKYRGPPSIELDREWDRLWNRGAAEIPIAHINELNRTSEDVFHINGDESRGANSILEVFHQLHCLNLIRQYTWKDYYTSHIDSWSDSTTDRALVDIGLTAHTMKLDRMHVDHCIETLRLTLMCNADVTPLLMKKDSSKESGKAADFNTFHKCRNFDAVVEWQDKHNSDLE